MSKIWPCVILGGGVAGLSAANQLVDAGLLPLIIDASEYPSHKICGEFLSPECHDILYKWDIPLSPPLEMCHLFIQGKRSAFLFPHLAASCSRFILDAGLLNRAQGKGAKVMTNTLVTEWRDAKDFYELTLSHGEVIKAKHLIIGTGRIPKLGNPTFFSPKYVGFKAHFERIGTLPSLDMYCFKGGYLGIAPVDEKTSNLACLVRKEEIEKGNILPNFVTCLLEEKKAKMVFPKWLVAELPEFGLKYPRYLDRVFWIGDAAGSIPPISGNGLALGITSGCMAADYLLKSNAEKFQKAWLKRYRKRFLWASLLHKIMLSSKLSRAALTICNKFPGLATTFWNHTRETP